MIPNAPITPFWFKQRQAKAEAAGENTLRLTGPNLQEAFVSLRQADNGKYQGVVRLAADGPDLAVTEPMFDNLHEAWEATFELYRQIIVV
jgi:hypothetical protein